METPRYQDLYLALLARNPYSPHSGAFMQLFVDLWASEYPSFLELRLDGVGDKYSKEACVGSLIQHFLKKEIEVDLEHLNQDVGYLAKMFEIKPRVNPRVVEECYLYLKMQFSAKSSCCLKCKKEI